VYLECFGLLRSSFNSLTTLPDGLQVSGFIVYRSPAPFLASWNRSMRCESMRPEESDREYWEQVLGVLGVTLEGCWGAILKAVSPVKLRLLRRRNLEPWQRVAIREFRG
jgi:hypothetical protein